MEADGALSLLKQLHKRGNSKLYIEHMVADDDSSMKSIFRHEDKDDNKSKGR